MYGEKRLKHIKELLVCLIQAVCLIWGTANWINLNPVKKFPTLSRIAIYPVDSTINLLGPNG